MKFSEQHGQVESTPVKGQFESKRLISASTSSASFGSAENVSTRRPSIRSLLRGQVCIVAAMVFLPWNGLPVPAPAPGSRARRHDAPSTEGYARSRSASTRE